MKKVFKRKTEVASVRLLLSRSLWVKLGGDIPKVLVVFKKKDKSVWWSHNLGSPNLKVVKLRRVSNYLFQMVLEIVRLNFAIWVRISFRLLIITKKSKNFARKVCK